jgi:hypothetical protein
LGQQTLDATNFRSQILLDSKGLSIAGVSQLFLMFFSCDLFLAIPVFFLYIA